MEELYVELENCYGIRKLSNTFNFYPNKNQRTNVMYAPNGVMKTSFTKVFQKKQNNKEKEIKDNLFEKQPVIHNITIDGENINSEDILVINSFENFYESHSLIDLLVNEDLKKKIDHLLENRNSLFQKLENKSGLKILKKSQGKEIYELEDTLKQDFNIDSFLRNIQTINIETDEDYAHIPYNHIFDDSVLKKITDKSFQNTIDEFIQASQGIYAEYQFLEQGEFTLGKLKNVEKALRENQFFVKNTINLYGRDDSIDLDTLKSYVNCIEDQLKQTPAYKTLVKNLTDAKGIKLHDIIENNPSIIHELKEQNLENFRIKLWKSYLDEHRKEFEELQSAVQEFQEEMKNTTLEESVWSKAYSIFKERFIVPFDMNIINKESVLLGESLPKVSFEFTDEETDEKVEKSRDYIENDILSQGEKRALYLLYIVFDIEKRRQQGQKTLYIIDDIADSFDYKNKYAIIEYLREISENENFYSIILTHNFDFYRALCKRLDINNKQQRLFAEKVKKGVNIEKNILKESPFKNWKENPNENKIIAMIPLLRNLIEYSHENQKEFLQLTHILHKKQQTKYGYDQNKNNKIRSVTFDNQIQGEFEICATDTIGFQNVSDIYNKYLGVSIDSIIDSGEYVQKKIYYLADSIKNSNLENKIILAMATRLKAEEFMISKIEAKDPTFSVSDITSNQTCNLYIKYKTEYPDDKDTLKTLDRVQIMTPENIHLNAFMYEPLIDMGIDELKKLYKDVCKLNQN